MKKDSKSFIYAPEIYAAFAGIVASAVIHTALLVKEIS